jgi:hypothetical protein
LLLNSATIGQRVEERQLLRYSQLPVEAVTYITSLI